MKRLVEEGENGKKKQKVENIYLSSIDRKKLDFDFEKICCVTLSNINIYGCLVCGKYFQGRGKSSPAFLHSIDEDHHIFINFDTLKVYSLPENELIESNSLNDIKYSVFPIYTKDEIDNLNNIESIDLNGNSYKPGFIGLNNIKANDYMNVILQAISHTNLIKEMFLINNDSDFYKNELNKRFMIFIKKLWSPKLFKTHISPHEVLQHIGVLSNKNFTLNLQKNPKDFLLWFLNNLHKSLMNESKKSIISTSFQGKLKIITNNLNNELIEEKSSKFWILTFDLPSVSFNNGSSINNIPQIKLNSLLKKYTNEEDMILPNEIKRFKIEKYPPFLIFHFNRFKDLKLNMNLLNKERNQTIIEFPLEINFNENKIKYKLVSNVIHQCNQNSIDLNDDYQSNWLIQLRRNNDWLEINNLQVKPKEKELLFLSESYIQIWQRTK